MCPGPKSKVVSCSGIPERSHAAADFLTRLRDEEMIGVKFGDRYTADSPVLKCVRGAGVAGSAGGLNQLGVAVSDEREEFHAGGRVREEGTMQLRSGRCGSGLPNPSVAHAEMTRVNNDGNAVGAERLIDRVGDLSRQLFLDLKSFGKDVHDSDQFR